jgi:hypothetical protein
MSAATDFVIRFDFTAIVNSPHNIIIEASWFTKMFLQKFQWFAFLTQHP